MKNHEQINARAEPTPDDLNDIAREVVDEIHPRRPFFSADDEYEWCDASDRLFLAACRAMRPDMTADEARAAARAAISP